MTTTPGIPLYARTSHVIARGVAGALAILGAAGLLVGGFELVRRPTLPQIAMLLVFVAVALGMVNTLLRARPIFGTKEGLVTADRSGSKLFPWSQVGNVECPVSSFNPVLRTYYVSVPGEERIYFFAGPRQLEQLERLRSHRAT